MSEHEIWHQRAVCPSCGKHWRAPFGEPSHVNVGGHFITCCPSCGGPGPHGWAVETMRWVDTGNFWKPSTWGTGHWEKRP